MNYSFANKFIFPLAFEHYSPKKPKHLRWCDSVPFLFIENNKSDVVLLYCHGNGEDLGMVHEHLELLSTSLCVNIVACEYPGYGLYQTRFPSEGSVNDTVLTIYEYMVERMHIPSSKIVIVGRSIGTGPATQLSTLKKTKGLVLISPFLSIREMAKEKISEGLVSLCQNRFPNDENILKTECGTVLFIHGEKDRVVSAKHSRSLFNLCKVQKKLKIVIDCGHNDIDVSSGLIMPINTLLNEIYGTSRKLKKPANVYLCPAPKETTRDTLSSAANNTFVKNSLMITCSFIESSCALSSAFLKSVRAISCASSEKAKQA